MKKENKTSSSIKINKYLSSNEKSNSIILEAVPNENRVRRKLNLLNINGIILSTNNDNSFTNQIEQKKKPLTDNYLIKIENNSNNNSFIYVEDKFEKLSRAEKINTSNNNKDNNLLQQKIQNINEELSRMEKDLKNFEETNRQMKLLLFY